MELQKKKWGWPPPKETTATAKERLDFLVEVQEKVYYGLKMMARKFRKYGQVESIAVHLQNTPIYYVNYKKGRRWSKCTDRTTKRWSGKGSSHRGEKCQCE